MFTREDHRHFAVECLRFAAEAEDDREQQIFLEMADAWTVVAFEDHGRSPERADIDPRQRRMAC